MDYCKSVAVVERPRRSESGRRGSAALLDAGVSRLSHGSGSSLRRCWTAKHNVRSANSEDSFFFILAIYNPPVIRA
jgi:hypothetical protein